MVMSYHSLEDRLVKHFMRSGNFEDDVQKDMKGRVLAPFHPLVRKAIVAQEEEMDANPRARSARLRVAERTEWMPLRFLGFSDGPNPKPPRARATEP